MVRLLPVLLVVLAAIGFWYFSSWRLGRLLDRESRPLADPVLGAHAASFAAVLGLTGLRVLVLDNPTVNGLAAPDGRIFLTSGFVARYRAGQVSADELASVIAHELGHVALGHSRRRLIDFAGMNVVRMLLMLILGRLIPFVGVWLADIAARLLMAGLSRRDEFEADEYAAALMTKAGLGTGPQKALLAKLGRLAPGATGAGMPEWLMSHPKAEARIAAIEALEARWRAEDRAGPAGLPGPERRG